MSEMHFATPVADSRRQAAWHGFGEAAIAKRQAKPAWYRKFGILKDTKPDDTYFTKSLGFKGSTIANRTPLLSVWGFFFNWVYYLQLGMYRRAFVVFAAGIVTSTIAALLNATNSLPMAIFSIFVLALVPLYCLVFTSRDFYMDRVKQQKFWTTPPLAGLGSYPIVIGLAVGSIILSFAVDKAIDNASAKTTPAVTASANRSRLLSDVNGVWYSRMANGNVRLTLGLESSRVITPTKNIACNTVSVDPAAGIVKLDCGGGTVHPVVITKHPQQGTSFKVGFEVVGVLPEDIMGYVSQ